ncbi:unnamed protein product, partial [Pylaiella littoralis]
QVPGVDVCTAHTRMPSIAFTATLCAFAAPCYGFVSPVHPGGLQPTGGTPSLYAASKTAAIARSNAAIRSCRVLSSSSSPRHSGAGAFAAHRHAGRRIAPSRSSGGGLAMMVAGGEGGCEMEGEVAGDGAESVPIAQTEGDEQATAPAAAPAAPKEEQGSSTGHSSSSSTSSSLPGSADSTVADESGGSGPGRRREAPLTEREGFAVARKVLPGGGEGLEMDLEALRVMRSEVNKLKRGMRRAAEEEDYELAGELRNEMAAIRARDPLYVIGDLLGVAVSKEKFKRAARLRDAKDWLLRESRGSVFEVDRLVCLGNKASNIITTDPEGATVRRFLRNDQA